MAPFAATAIINARARARSGWPMVLLTVALYSPVGGLPRLALLATAVFFLAQGDAPRTARTPSKTHATRSAPATKTAAPAKARTTKVPRQRTTGGRWTK